MFLIPKAYAEAATSIATTQGQANGAPAYTQFLMLGGFILIFWLLIWRPQNKKAKAHRNLINNLTKGDEIITTGGLLGRITKVTDNYITLQVSENVDLSFQKNAIASILPKGTLKEIK